MKRISSTLLLLACISSACATDSSENILLGEWGGPGLRIRASATAVRIDMPCDTPGVLAGPVEIGADGSFEFELTMHQFYGDFDLDIEGQMDRGRILEVSVETEYGRPANQPVQLWRNVRPDFTDYGCEG